MQSQMSLSFPYNICKTEGSCVLKVIRPGFLWRYIIWRRLFTFDAVFRNVIYRDFIIIRKNTEAVKGRGPVSVLRGAGAEYNAGGDISVQVYLWKYPLSLLFTILFFNSHGCFKIGRASQTVKLPVINMNPMRMVGLTIRRSQPEYLYRMAMHILLQ